MLVSANGTTSINSLGDSIEDCYDPYYTFALLLSSVDYSNNWANKKFWMCWTALLQSEQKYFLTQSLVFSVVLMYEHFSLNWKNTFETLFMMTDGCWLLTSWHLTILALLFFAKSCNIVTLFCVEKSHCHAMILWVSDGKCYLLRHVCRVNFNNCSRFESILL